MNQTKQINVTIKKNNINIDKFYYNKLFEFYDVLNKDQSHMLSKDDICTPMECIKKNDRLHTK